MSTIEKNVMASVRVMYGIRTLVSASAIKLYIIIAALYVIGRMVWVAHVFENLQRVGLGHSFEFFLSAILNTQLLVQLALLIATLAIVSFLVDLVRGSTRNSAFA